MNAILDFYNLHKDSAIREQERAGINHIAILAQAAFESGYGKYAFGNNFFGIKANSSWTGDKQLLRTTEYHKSPSKVYPVILSLTKVTKHGIELWEYKIKDWFRKYETPVMGFSDHSDFFFKNKRYAEALLVKHDALNFLLSVVKAGYATDPNYMRSLLPILNYYQTL